MGFPSSVSLPVFPGHSFPRAWNYEESPLPDLLSGTLDCAQVHSEVQIKGLVRSEAAATQERFRRLVDLWKQDTRFLSSTTRKIHHSAYQEIVGMGRDAIPFILHELRDQPDDWFWALQAISGESPDADCEPGRFDLMRDRWLEWGRLHGFLP
jgi:hypothetical protein